MQKDQNDDKLKTKKFNLSLSKYWNISHEIREKVINLLQKKDPFETNSEKKDCEVWTLHPIKDQLSLHFHKDPSWIGRDIGS